MYKNLVFLTLTYSLSVSAAEPKQLSYYIGGQVGHAEMDGAHHHQSGNELQRGSFFGGQFGIRPFDNESWEFRFKADRAELSVDNVSDDEEAIWYAVDAMYFINSGYNYLFAGPHQEDFDSASQTGAHVGLGARYHVSDSWALTGEIQGLYGFEDQTTDFMASVGLLYFFGSKSSGSVAPESDSDQDGVSDSKDSCPETPIGYVVDHLGCTRFIEEAIVKQVSIYFAHDEDTIAPRHYRNVKEVADFMQKHPQLNILIEGHTSMMGSEKYNKKLSEKRAIAVSDLLNQKYHISAERLKTVGYGEERPVVNPELNSEDQAKNRRVEVDMSANERKAMVKQ